MGRTRVKGGARCLPDASPHLLPSSFFPSSLPLAAGTSGEGNVAVEFGTAPSLSLSSASGQLWQTPQSWNRPRPPHSPLVCPVLSWASPMPKILPGSFLSHTQLS